MKKPIIVGTDFSSGSYAALELAVDIANRMQTDILLIWAQRAKILASTDQVQMMERLANDKLLSLCAEWQPKMKHGIIRHEVYNGKVGAGLSAVARREDAVMMVIGTNGASGFEKYLMGSTAVRIVQEASCPVLTIREGFNFHKKLERIVVPLRINANSRQKVPPAASMAKIFDSEVCILGLLDMAEDEMSLRTYMKQATDYLETEKIRYSTTIRKYNDYSDAVLHFADGIKADLVIINTEQDKIISQIFLGTNAQQIVHRSQIPVLCIHPEDYINVSAKI
ncbi:MAG: universal stress protein [Bacteroidales bacterium]|nr:universal stress protein [Bacteroidales bacterium]